LVAAAVDDPGNDDECSAASVVDDVIARWKTSQPGSISSLRVPASGARASKDKRAVMASTARFAISMLRELIAT
jgi:hypothetical protein